MRLHVYLNGVNKTFKKDTPDKELLHCCLGITTELGEILDLMKKHYCYGVPKDDKWDKELALEIGDLVYYITKMAELTDNLDSIEKFFEGLEIPDHISIPKEIPYAISILEDSCSLYNYSSICAEFEEKIPSIMLFAIGVAKINDINFDSTLFTNLRKLETRHGSSFKIETSFEDGRDRAKETNS
jgi:hypothetical protein